MSTANSFWDVLNNIIESHPYLVVGLISVLLLALISIIITFLIAFYQGREISLWPPKFGPKPTKEKPSPIPSKQDAGEIISSKKIIKSEKDVSIRVEAYEDVIPSVTFEVMGPSYILSTKDYVFIDWNPAFELIFATYKFRRGDIVDRWIESLDNCKDVKKRGLQLFEYGMTPPHVDHETLVYSSKKYGRMIFTKSAAQTVSSKTGKLAEWIITLNIDAVEKKEKYLNDLERIIIEYQHWRIYNSSYDPILTVFEPYMVMVRQFVDVVSNCGERILDLGAGTGNLTLELLKKGKKVYAIDYSDAMLSTLRKKCEGYNNSLRVIKQNIDTMQISSRKGEIGKYDGITMLNVLFTLENPRRCLEQCYKALTSGGILIFSGPKKGISLDNLLDNIQKYLRDRGLWERLRDNFEIVRQRNDFMRDSRILKQFDTNEINSLLKDIGFTVQHIDSKGYMGDDMVVITKK